MRTSLLLALAAAMFVVGASPAHADFRVIGNAPPAPAVAPDTVAPRAGYVSFDGTTAAKGETPAPSSRGFGLVAVNYVGSPPAEIEVRQGMGRSVRIADALKQIAPPGWRGFGRADVADSFDPNRIVSWKGGRPWTAVLDILANEQDLSIEVDWQRKHMYVGKREYKSAISSDGYSAAAALWTAKKGATVRGTLEEWAKRAGWTIVWPMEDLDYRVVAPLTFDGSVADAAGKLARLFESAERPIAVTIHTPQKLLVFSEKRSAQ